MTGLGIGKLLVAIAALGAIVWNIQHGGYFAGKARAVAIFISLVAVFFLIVDYRESLKGGKGVLETLRLALKRSFLRWFS